MVSYKELKNYFENTKGTGVLSTADLKGKVNAAVYSRPHFFEDETVGLIMRDRLTHHNMLSNPSGVYSFNEEGEGYKGKRLYLTKVREEKNSPLIDQLKRRSYEDDQDGDRFLVYFKIDKSLPLVGTGEEQSD